MACNPCVINISKKKNKKKKNSKKGSEDMIVPSKGKASKIGLNGTVLVDGEIVVKVKEV